LNDGTVVRASPKNDPLRVAPYENQKNYLLTYHLMTNRRNFLKRTALLGAAVTLPVHHLLAQSAESRVKPAGDGLSPVSYGREMTRKSTPRKITIPHVGEYMVLKGDFHMHTVFSDGSVMPQDRVREAIDNGLDVISMTDHINSALFRAYPDTRNVVTIADRHGAIAPKIDQHIPYILAKPEAEKNDLILIRGVEIASREWHHNCLFVQDVNAIAEANEKRTLLSEGNDWKKMLAVSAEQGGFNFWNHPDNVIESTPDKKAPLRFFEAINDVRAKGHLHGVEVFNGTSFYPVALDWCNEHDMVPMANTDIHSSEWSMYGHQNLLRPMTLVLAKERTHDSIREAFFAGRMIGWAAGMILGRPLWVEQLFRSSVNIEKAASGLTLRNLSDIPCLIEINGKSSELSAKGTLAIAATNKLTVSNWFVGMNKPLEITM